jgi:hypothetical protein
MILKLNKRDESPHSFLPLIKGEMKEGVGDLSSVSNLPLSPSFIRRGNPT